MWVALTGATLATLSLFLSLTPAASVQLTRGKKGKLSIAVRLFGLRFTITTKRSGRSNKGDQSAKAERLRAKKGKKYCNECRKRLKRGTS